MSEEVRVIVSMKVCQQYFIEAYTTKEYSCIFPNSATIQEIIDKFDVKDISELSFRKFERLGKP